MKNIGYILVNTVTDNIKMDLFPNVDGETSILSEQLLGY